jgi:hypothetical protein
VAFDDSFNGRYQASARRLIVNADDFGLTDGVNQAILELNAAGALSSATLMATGKAFRAAVHASFVQTVWSTARLSCRIRRFHRWQRRLVSARPLASLSATCCEAEFAIVKSRLRPQRKFSVFSRLGLPFHTSIHTSTRICSRACFAHCYGQRLYAESALSAIPSNRRGAFAPLQRRDWDAVCR